MQGNAHFELRPVPQYTFLIVSILVPELKVGSSCSVTVEGKKNQDFKLSLTGNKSRQIVLHLQPWQHNNMLTWLN